MRYIIRLEEGITLATDFEPAPSPRDPQGSPIPAPSLRHIVAQRVEWDGFHARWEPLDGIENLSYNPRKVIVVHDTDCG